LSRGRSDSNAWQLQLLLLSKPSPSSSIQHSFFFKTIGESFQNLLPQRQNLLSVDSAASTPAANKPQIPRLIKKPNLSEALSHLDLRHHPLGSLNPVSPALHR
jgi:hypothetical protein